MSNNAALTLNESDIILRSTLSPDQYGDHKIISFIANYMRTLHVPTAAKESGITTSQGYNMLNIPEVYNVIGKLNQKSAAKGGFKAEALVRMVQQINDVNLFDCLNDDGTVKDKKQMPLELQLAFKKFKVRVEYENDFNGVPTGIVKSKIYDFELYDKLKTAELLGRQEQIFKQTSVVQHDIGKNAGNILHGGAIERSQARVAEMREVGPSALPQIEDVDHE